MRSGAPAAERGWAGRGRGGGGAAGEGSVGGGVPHAPRSCASSSSTRTSLGSSAARNQAIQTRTIFTDITLVTRANYKTPEIQKLMCSRC